MKPLFCPAEDSSISYPLNTVAEKRALKWAVERLGGTWRETDDKCFASLKPPTPQATKTHVPFYYLQRDNGGGQSERSCFSACVAMILNDYRPNVLIGPNGDDQYLSRLLTYGDTTSAQAQKDCLAHFGLKSEWSQGMTLAQLDERLEQGLLTSCGLLHHGVIGSELYGGHHILPYGRTATGYLCHDPYGELDMVTGTWVRVGTSPGTSPGRSVEYSRKNFGARWCPKGNDGWGLMVQRP